MGKWNNWCALSGVNSALNINAANNTNSFVTPMAGAAYTEDQTTLVPSAFTVQIMNPEALQTTTGIVYAGVMNTQFSVSGRTETWDAFFQRFVEFQAPRVMAAAKLAIKGVQVSSYPLNMSKVSEFANLSTVSDFAGFTLTSQQGEAVGWAPILVYNPDAIELQYLVTTEYRMRFDLTNPAAGAHRLHPISTDKNWGDMITRAVSMGHGVIDIADKIADMGSMVNRGIQSAGRLMNVARPALAMLEA
jgi:hypothetical protein